MKRQPGPMIESAACGTTTGDCCHCCSLLAALRTGITGPHTPTHSAPVPAPLLEGEVLTQVQAVLPFWFWTQPDPERRNDSVDDGSKKQ
jgi:hypothetical protein